MITIRKQNCYHAISKNADLLWAPGPIKSALRINHEICAVLETYTHIKSNRYSSSNYRQIYITTIIK